MFILKHLRRKKNISQTNLARAIGVSLRTIQLYEKKDANIPIKNLTKIAQYFDLSIAELYLHEVNETSEIYTDDKIISKKGHQIKRVGIGKYLITVPLVSGEKQEAYVQSFENDTFLSQLSLIGFVIEQIEDREYAAFEITNNSMYNGSIEGIPNKSIVLGKKVTEKEFVHMLTEDYHRIWILVSALGILCKSISAYDDKMNTILCHSLNSSPEYSDFQLKLDDIDQCFLVVKRQVG